MPHPLNPSCSLEISMRIRLGMVSCLIVKMMLVSPGLAKVSPGLPNETVSLVTLTIPPQAAFTEMGYVCR